jgi:drug/metabolite transporter (DMT)-like permease
VHHLLFAIASSTVIGLVFKLAETRVANRFTLLMGNYLIAALIALGMWAHQGASLQFSGLSMLLAVLAGAAFAGNFFLLMVFIKKRGVALPVILLRLSAIVPIGASILFFSEQPSGVQIAGLLGALIAAGLLSVSVRGGEFGERPSARVPVLLVLTSLAALFCFGLSDLMLKIFDELGSVSEKPLFLLILFSVALGVFAVALMFQRSVPTRKDLLWGFALGVPNLLSAYFIVSALHDLPAFVVFPVVSAGTVMAISILAALLFKERLGVWGIFGIVLTVLSIIAVNWNGLSA